MSISAEDSFLRLTVCNCDFEDRQVARSPSLPFQNLEVDFVVFPDFLP